MINIHDKVWGLHFDPIIVTMTLFDTIHATCWIALVIKICIKYKEPYGHKYPYCKNADRNISLWLGTCFLFCEFKILSVLYETSRYNWSFFSFLAILIDGLVQERRNSIANALELRLSCTNPSIWLHTSRFDRNRASCSLMPQYSQFCKDISRCQTAYINIKDH